VFTNVAYISSFHYHHPPLVIQIYSQEIQDLKRRWLFGASTFELYICGMSRKLKNNELKRLDIAGFKAATKTPLVLVLDNIRSLNNIGSVFRTADAFLVEKIYLCGITATPPHKDIHKTALGATESVAWEHCTDALQTIVQLKEEGYTILAVEQAENSIALQDFLPSKTEKYVLVFGNEVKGVSQDVVSKADAVLEIPQYGTKHSLNISVSAGVLIWDFWAKLKSLGN